MSQVAIHKVNNGEKKTLLPILEEISKRFEAVNERAFELCERRGRKHGHEREDWFQAESERLGSLSAELTENDGALDE